MLTIITGQPGNGKTLLLLQRVEEKRKAENRPVFYSGIPDLALPWEKLGDLRKQVERWRDPEDDIEKWRFILPPGAIVVVDESQEIFRVRSQGAEVPPHVQALERHRHGGVDFFFTTQHPQLLDVNVRKLAGRHIHVVRRFGRERATLYQWEQVRDPTSERDKKDALREDWKFPTKVYGWYKSAEQHTVKRDFPLKLVLRVGALAVVAIGLIGYAVWRMAAPVREQHAAQELAGASATASVHASPQIAAGGFWDAVSRQPRVDGYPESAPLYDHLQVVQSQPRPVGCASLVYETGAIKECRCVTDQGTLADVSVQRCMAFIASRGEYDPRREPPKERERAEPATQEGLKTE